MHHSRLCALLIDCNTDDVDAAAAFWAEALGRNGRHGASGHARQLPHAGDAADEPIVQIQRVEHESRVHLDIETDDIPAEVARLEKLGATVVRPTGALGRHAGADRAALLRGARPAPGLPEERQHLGS